MGRKFLNLERQGASPRPTAKVNEFLLYANSEGVKVVDEDGAEWPIGAADPGSHTHSQYAQTGHSHGETEHPDLAAHESLGLAPEHDHPFAADDHTHPMGSHPDLAAHELLGLSGDDHTHDTTHNHDGDYSPVHSHPYSADDHSHAEYATDDDLTTHAATTHGTTVHAISGVSHTGTLDHSALGSVTANQHHNQAHALGGGDHTGALAQASVTDLEADLAGKAAAVHTHAYAADDHTHSATQPYAVGDLYMTTTNHVDAAAVATRHGYGTWARWGQGRFILGATADAEVEAGSATHAHTFTQPDAHAALSHAGATVGNHTFTQPAGHSAHTFTQPTAHGTISSHAGATVGAHTFTQPSAHSDHGALSHSAHAGATVGNHTFTQPSGHSNHAVTQPNAHTDVLNHVHTENINTATTGGVVGFPALKDTSTSGSEATGLVTSNPTANGVASQVHAGTAVDAHSAHSGGAVDAHTVGQASAHSDHGTQSHSAHSGGAVDAHTVGQASDHSALTNNHAAVGVDAHSAHSGGAVDAHSVGQANQHGAQSHANGAVASGSTDPLSITAFLWKRTA